MSIIKFISLYQFKNYENANFEFSSNKVCLVGKNGTGKTNLLDAIYFLCFTKSYFHHNDQFIIQQHKNGLRINALLNNEEITVIIRADGQKEILLNNIAYSKKSDHVGKFCAVMISPDDISLINGSGEERRKFIDRTICQLNSEYLKKLVQYNKYLKLRNAYFKNLTSVEELNSDLLAVYDEKICEFGNYIFQERKKYLSTFNQKVEELYFYFADKNEKIDIVYQSSLNYNSLENLLKENLFKDVMSKRSNYGIHKDDLGFLFNKLPFKSIASQGQKKSFLFALKLAEFEMLKSTLNQQTFLLLDDIFEKLDAYRSQKLIAYLMQQQQQIFITDTHKSRVEEAFKSNLDQIQLIELN